MKHYLNKFFCLAAFAAVSAIAAPTYEYALIDQTGKTVTQKDFPEQYQLIAFGFTHCPDVCPTTLFDFKQVLANMQQPERLQAIFITIDPHRDSPETLAKYTGYFDKRILALGGERAAIDQAVENFNATYGYQIDGKKAEYFHSTLIYLLDKEGELLDIFDYQSGHKQLLAGIEASIAAREQQ